MLTANSGGIFRFAGSSSSTWSRRSAVSRGRIRPTSQLHAGLLIYELGADLDLDFAERHDAGHFVFFELDDMNTVLVRTGAETSPGLSGFTAARSIVDVAGANHPSSPHWT